MLFRLHWEDSSWVEAGGRHTSTLWRRRESLADFTVLHIMHGRFHGLLHISWHIVTTDFGFVGARVHLWGTATKKCRPQAAADRAAASSAAPARLPETIKDRAELLGAEGLVASAGATASSQCDKLEQPGRLAAAEWLARTIKTE